MNFKKYQHPQAPLKPLSSQFKLALSLSQVSSKQAREERMILSLLLSSLLLLSSASASLPSNGTTIYELLPKFGLPPGLLPDTVRSYSLSVNGRFQVELESPCYVDFEYLVYYDTNITGVIKYGGIDELKGIQVRRFLLWFDVDAIKVDLPPSEYIYFEVGWITKKLRVDQFQTVHSCNKEKLSDRIVQFLEPAREMDLLITE